MSSRLSLRRILPAAAVLMLLASARTSSTVAGLCAVAMCVLLAHGLCAVACQRLAPHFARFGSLCAAAAIASIGWSWLSATQTLAGHTSAVPLLVVLALIAATSGSDSDEDAAPQDEAASIQDDETPTQGVDAGTRDATP